MWLYQRKNHLIDRIIFFTYLDSANLRKELYKVGDFSKIFEYH